MADNKQEKGSHPESPTTAKQLDFDDEPESTTNTTSKPKPASVEDEEPPAKPPRSMNPQHQAEQTLIEAFPSIDSKVVRAVLSASGGQVEPAFNALLGMSDPSAQLAEVPPPQPPRPTAAQRQLEQDELYARQLAQHYQSTERAQREGYAQRPPRQDSRRQAQQDELYSRDDRDRNFFDDDLPEITKSMREGFLETQKTVNGWISTLKKRLDGDENDPLDGPTRHSPPPRNQRSDYHYVRGGEHAARSRPSGDYDADPREFGDDFGHLELRDEEVPPPKPARPSANPDLFKPTPAPPQTGPVDEIEAAERKNPGGGAGGKKWQPLTSVAPQPEQEDNDPFSVGDSDDEKETAASKSKDVREADTARLKKAASQSGGEADRPKPEGLQEKKRGSVANIDKDAEELLAKK